MGVGSWELGVGSWELGVGRIVIVAEFAPPSPSKTVKDRQNEKIDRAGDLGILKTRSSGQHR
jgi:hypothetical protein